MKPKYDTIQHDCAPLISTQHFEFSLDTFKDVFLKEKWLHLDEKQESIPLSACFQVEFPKRAEKRKEALRLTLSFSPAFPIRTDWFGKK